MKCGECGAMDDWEETQKADEAKIAELELANNRLRKTWREDTEDLAKVRAACAEEIREQAERAAELETEVTKLKLACKHAVETSDSRLRVNEQQAERVAQLEKWQCREIELNDECVRLTEVNTRLSERVAKIQEALQPLLDDCSHFTEKDRKIFGKEMDRYEAIMKALDTRQGAYDPDAEARYMDSKLTEKQRQDCIEQSEPTVQDFTVPPCICGMRHGHPGPCAIPNVAAQEVCAACRHPEDFHRDDHGRKDACGADDCLCVAWKPTAQGDSEK